MQIYGLNVRENSLTIMHCPKVWVGNTMAPVILLEKISYTFYAPAMLFGGWPAIYFPWSFLVCVSGDVLFSTNHGSSAPNFFGILRVFVFGHCNISDNENPPICFLLRQ